MVCRNCGADLKPGIKYCLNCGEYLSNNEIEMLETGESNLPKENISTVNKDFENTPVPKKKHISTKKIKDIIIYAVLFLILIVSILVIVFSNINKKEEIIEKPITYQDNVVDMGTYKITFSGKLNYVIEGLVVYIVDDDNYVFSYKAVKGHYNDYTGDELERQLLKSGYEILDNEVKTVDSKEFIIYSFDDGQTVRHLYVTEIDDEHIAMGNVEEKSGGNWESSLNTIVRINKSIEFISEENSIDETSGDVVSSSSNIATTMSD